MNTWIEIIAGWLDHSACTALFFDAWLKSLAVLAVAGGLCLVLRRAAAATRHWIWFLALASLPGLLLLAAVPHAGQPPLWSVSTGFASGNQFSLMLNLAPTSQAANPSPAVASARPAPAGAGEGRAGSRPPLATHFSATMLVLGLLAWLAGIVAGLLYVLAGQVQLHRLARNALPLETSDWARLLQDAGLSLRLRRPVRLLQSDDNPMPLTWGWWRPVILLPAEATRWPTERRRVVLLHELAHAKRWDCLTQTVARIVSALYWINPLVWLAARRMCVERERACDDLVLGSGCRASEYATHLVDIAQTFRRPAQFAGIAMARASQLHGRIAAIVDGARARRLRPLTAVAILVLMAVLALAIDGSGQGASLKQPQVSALRQQQLARLESFAQAKEKQSGALAARAGEPISSEFQSFFDAALKGDWRTVTNRYEYFKLHHPQYSKGTNRMEVQLRTAYWQPVLELCLAYDHVVNCEPEYTSILADGIINSIPAGSIYFGGTDPGRGVPTAFCKSHVDGDPFFTLTQNALADGTYLEYLRVMYGSKIYTPTGEDSQRCFQEYLSDAQSRLAENKLKPGEDVRIIDGKVIVSGQAAVMAINGLLTKVIFEHNPDREFYIEESFPLDWMYPYLEPHGLIMKLNRQPLAQLPEDVIAQDHDYWRKLVAGMLGDWLDEKTTVREAVEFVDRVHVRHDLQGFTGDPRFIQNDYAKKLFSKLRSSIAGIYAWRFRTNMRPTYPPKPHPEASRLINQADLAFRQAFALCPDNLEALSGYVNWLVPFLDMDDDRFRKAQELLESSAPGVAAEIQEQQTHRVDDALLLTETVLKLDPQNAKAQEIWKSLKRRSQPQPGHAGDATNILAEPGKADGHQ